MGKRSWFSMIRKFFVSDGHSNSEKGKRSRSRSRRVFGFLKPRRLASLEAPPLNSTDQSSLNEAEKNKAKDEVHTSVVVQAPPPLLPVADISQISGKEKEDQEVSGSAHFSRRELQYLAAIRIQTAFRGYLARKALRALKGLVRLQAIIRGRAVRRQAITTLKCLQSIVNIQSQVTARRSRMLEGTDLHDIKVKEIKVDSNSERRLDDRIMSKEEAKALFLSKRESLIKRDRTKEYYLSHRRSADSERNKFNERWKHWLEQWVDNKIAKEEEKKNLERTVASNSGNEELERRRIKLRNSPSQYGTTPAKPGARRSFHHKKQISAGDDSNFPISPVLPSYMATTESAKAKARSLSSPRQRPGSLDSYSETHSPYKNKLLITSFNSEAATSSNTICTSKTYQDRSPGLKGLPGAGSAKLSRN